MRALKVSVIIPVFNGEKMIKRCIESVLNQTLSDIEIIVVNDGSTDLTADVLSGFENIKVIEQENRGQGMARNIGMDAATGDYIGFVDADDTIEPQMYEKMYALAVDNNAEIVQCNLTDIYPNGDKKIQLSDFEGMVEITDNADYMSRYMAGYIHSYEVCNKIFKCEFIRDTKLKFGDTKKYFSEDILFNMEAVKHLKRISFIKEPYYNYYQCDESHMHGNLAERLEKMVCLFDDYLKTIDGVMKNSASYLASMVTLYNIGKCNAPIPLSADKKLCGYIKDGLKAKCTLKKRLYLTAVLLSPQKFRIKLAKMCVKD